MKRLNKKGFTLVELLAVIVILALLIVVVANTALPAMQNTKKSALETYSKRVVEQAKTLYMTDNNACKTTACTIANIMGETSTQYDAEITITETSGVISVSGYVGDKKNSLIATINNSVVSTPSNMLECKQYDNNATDCAKYSKVCKWTAGAATGTGTCSNIG